MRIENSISGEKPQNPDDVKIYSDWKKKKSSIVKSKREKHLKKGERQTMLSASKWFGMEERRENVIKLCTLKVWVEFKVHYLREVSKVNIQVA